MRPHISSSSNDITDGQIDRPIKRLVEPLLDASAHFLRVNDISTISEAKRAVNVAAENAAADLAAEYAVLKKLGQRRRKAAAFLNRKNQADPVKAFNENNYKLMML